MKKRIGILIVEDSEEDAGLLLSMLRSEGYEVKYAVVDTEAAMRAELKRQEWDVIVSDHAMPSFSAPAALAVAKQAGPDIPFIIVSGEMDIDLAVSLMKSGAKDYIRKGELIRLVSAIERELAEVGMRRERRLAKDALVVSETRYRRLFETAQDGILILDADTGQILDVNPYLISMLGYSKEEFLGRKLWEIGAFQDKRESRINFEELRSKAYIRYEDLPLETREGSQIAVEFVSNVYVVDHARVAQCNIRNITARKRAEAELLSLHADLERRVQDRTVQLEALNKELETFNYAVSHDLRAPLRRIKGFADILGHDQAEPQSDASMKIIQMIRVSVDQMNRLIGALLDLARFSRQEIKRKKVDVSAMAHRIAAELQQSQPARQVEFAITDGITVNGDAQLLHIVLENLLSNAWKFTAKRTAAHIAFGRTAQANGCIAYFVRDDGAGFDMACADKLFGAFQRLHSPKEYPGIGIGLATVQRIVHRHGGRVWADGVVHQGATFNFSIGESCRG